MAACRFLTHRTSAPPRRPWRGDADAGRGAWLGRRCERASRQLGVRSSTSVAAVRSFMGRRFWWECDRCGPADGGFEGEHAVSEGPCFHASGRDGGLAGFEGPGGAGGQGRDVRRAGGSGGVDDDEVPVAAEVDERVAGRQDRGGGGGAELGGTAAEL